MISVVIPLYNKEKSIKATINSVLSQTFSSFEIVVIDDGSKDKSYEVVNQIQDPRIKVFSQSNYGVSSARNRGVAESKYEHIALLDADDIWLPNYLEEMFHLILEFPEASLYGCAYYFQKNEKSISTFYYGLNPLSKGIIDYFTYAKINTLFTSSSAIFKKKDFISLGGFDITLSKGEDIDLWIKFGLFKKVAYYNKSLVIYRLDAENRASNIKIDKKASLIYNLDRYKKYERNNPDFKKFLDEWRLNHISKFFNRDTNEIVEISSLLKDIDVRNRSPLWWLLKISPGFFHRIIYKFWFIFKDAFYYIRNESNG